LIFFAISVEIECIPITTSNSPMTLRDFTTSRHGA